MVCIRQTREREPMEQRRQVVARGLIRNRRQRHPCNGFLVPVEELLKLRDEVGRVLGQKATQLEEQLSMLGGEVGTAGPVAEAR